MQVNVQTVEEKIKYFADKFKDDVLYVKVSQLGWLDELLRPSLFYEEIILDFTYTTKKAAKLLDIVGREQLLLNYLNRNGFNQYVDVYRQGEKGNYKYNSTALFQFKMILLLIDHSVTPLEIGAILGISAEIAHEGVSETSPKKRNRDVDDALIKAEINDYLNEKYNIHQQKITEELILHQEEISKNEQAAKARVAKYTQSLLEGVQKTEQKMLLHSDLQFQYMEIQKKHNDWDTKMKQLEIRQEYFDSQLEEYRILEESLSIEPISKMQKLFTSKKELEKKEALKKQAEIRRNQLLATKEEIHKDYEKLKDEEKQIVSELDEIKDKLAESRQAIFQAVTTTPQRTITGDNIAPATFENSDKGSHHLVEDNNHTQQGVTIEPHKEHGTE